MYTVIIQKSVQAQSRRGPGDRATARELGQLYRRLFFQEYLDRGEVDFCAWNPDGNTVETALPDLYRLIAGKREWRAIVVLTPTEEERSREEQQGRAAREQNPFDFLVNREQNPYEVSESPIPLIRLTQLLGGVPKPEMRFERAEHQGEDGRYYVSFDPQKAEYEAAMEAHKRLSQQYLFVDNRPREILLISTRKPVDTSEQETRSAWSTRMESESSEFWSRNRYPSTCRFLAFDVLDERHSLFSGSIFRLWSAVLLLALNQVENSSLQAYRLYNLSVELDRGRLSAAFSRYATRLLGMNTLLDAAEANRESVERQAARQAPEIGGRVDVVFNIRRRDDLMISTRELGLATDVPRPERDVWNGQFYRASGALQELLRSPLRALDVAADDTRRRGEYPPELVELLNRYQRSDLEEDMEKVYFDVLDERSKLGFNVRRRQREREVIYQQVHRRITQRLDRRRIATISLITAAALVLGSLPYLIGAGRESFGALLWALLALLGTAAVAAGFGLAELWIQRREMVDAMEDHNRCMYEIDREVHASAQHYSNYLTALCTYLRGRSYLDREAELLRSRASAERMRSCHRKAIQKCLCQVRDWATALGAVLEIGVTDRIGDGFDPAVPPEENLAYRFDLPAGGRSVPLNHSGEHLCAPYDFIQGITLEREELFDDVDSDRDL